jgi:AraC-like DNA-binding protein
LTHPVPALAGVRPVSPPTYWRCEPGWSWHARPLTDPLLWYVLDGVGRVSVGEEHGELACGVGMVFAPGEAPVATHDPRRRLLVFGMHFQVDAAEAPASGGVVPPGRWCRVRDRALVESLARGCDAGYRRGDPLGGHQSRLYLEQILCLLWETATLPAPGRVDAALDAIARAIREDPSRRWSVAELAVRASLSRAQFTRRFTAHVGLPPARYVLRVRAERARRLLTETSMSVTQVATTLGYSDVAHFSRQYRQYTGHSPRRAR